MKATVVNIAKLAKVSPTLVSFVINNNSKQLARMNKDTVERVQRIAAKMGMPLRKKDLIPITWDPADRVESLVNAPQADNGQPQSWHIRIMQR